MKAEKKATEAKDDRIKIISRTPDVTVKRSSRPAIDLKFNGTEALVSKEVADFLVNDGTGRFKRAEE